MENLVWAFSGEAETVREGVHDEVDRVDDDVDLDDAEEAEGSDVTPFAALGSVAESEDELEQNEGEVEILDYRVDDGRCGVAEWPAPHVVRSRGCATNQVDDNFGS